MRFSRKGYVPVFKNTAHDHKQAAIPPQVRPPLRPPESRPSERRIIRASVMTVPAPTVNSEPSPSTTLVKEKPISLLTLIHLSLPGKLTSIQHKIRLLGDHQHALAIENLSACLLASSITFSSEKEFSFFLNKKNVIHALKIVEGIQHAGIIFTAEMWSIVFKTQPITNHELLLAQSLLITAIPKWLEQTSELDPAEKQKKMLQCVINLSNKKYSLQYIAEILQLLNHQDDPLFAPSSVRAIASSDNEELPESVKQLRANAAKLRARALFIASGVKLGFKNTEHLAEIKERISILRRSSLQAEEQADRELADLAKAKSNEQLRAIENEKAAIKKENLQNLLPHLLSHPSLSELCKIAFALHRLHSLTPENWLFIKDELSPDNHHPIILKLSKFKVFPPQNPLKLKELIQSMHQQEFEPASPTSITSRQSSFYTIDSETGSLNKRHQSAFNPRTIKTPKKPEHPSNSRNRNHLFGRDMRIPTIQVTTPRGNVRYPR